MEEKKRTVAELQQEYTNLAAKAGNLEYGMKVTKSDLDILYKQMRDLSFEAAKIQSEAKAESEKSNVQA